MPRYKVQAPDGRIITLEGDTPPNEQDLDQVFKSLPIASNESSSISQGLQALASPLKQAIKPQEQVQEYAENPKKTGIKLLQGTQMAGGLALPWLSGVTTTPTTEFAIQKLRGKETPEALKQAGIAGAIDMAIPVGGKLIKGAMKKAMPLATEMLAGVPKEATERAVRKEIAGESIFKDKFNKKMYQDLGEKAQEGITFLKENAGKLVSKEREALKSLKNNYNFDDVAKKIDELVAEKQFGRESVLSKIDLGKINYFSNKIKKLSQEGMNPGELYAIRKNIDELVKFDPQTVKKISTEGENVLKEARGIINERLKQISPNFSKASKKYSEIADLYNEIKPKLKDQSLAKNLKQIFKKDDYYEDVFRRFDEKLPKNMKFVDKLEDTVAKEQFQRLSPVIQTAETPMNLGLIFRGGSAIGTGGLALPAFSPLVHKEAIKLLGKPATGLSTGIKKGLALRIKDIINRRENDNTK